MHEQRRISKTHGSEGETLAIALDDVKGLLRSVGSVATWMMMRHSKLTLRTTVSLSTYICWRVSLASPSLVASDTPILHYIETAKSG